MDESIFSISRMHDNSGNLVTIKQTKPAYDPFYPTIALSLSIHHFSLDEHGNTSTVILSTIGGGHGQKKRRRPPYTMMRGFIATLSPTPIHTHGGSLYKYI